MVITIVNWEKYTGADFRKCVAPWWFKVSIDLFLGIENIQIGLEPKGFWTTLLAYAAKNKKAAFVYDTRIFSLATGLTPSAQDRYLEMFINLGWLTHPDNIRRSSGDHPDNFRLEEIEEREKKEEQNKTAPSEPTDAQQPSPKGVPFTVPDKSRQVWFKLYQDVAWIEREIQKAEAWCVANPRRAPKKDFARFVNNWLSRGWEDRRKTVTTPAARIRQIEELV